MPFPENTPLPISEPDLAGFPTGYDPADVASPAPADQTGPEAAAPGEQRLARRLFRRYERPAASPRRTAVLHTGLFLLTLLTTTLAGVQLTQAREDPVDWLPVGVFLLPGPAMWAELTRGLQYAAAFLGVLTVHEFGHYFVARRNRVATSLPYFIPFPLGLGTFGAVIRIRERIFSRREFFDIGLAGPLAGFVVALALLAYAFTHLPPLDYLFSIHPEYAQFGADYARHVYPPGTQGLTLARPLLYRLLETALADPARLPHPNELLHYPLLLAGVLSLFFTALNLLPMGQLDGGHILYGLIGPRAFNRLVPLLFVAFIFYAGLGLFTLHDTGTSWLYWAPVYAIYLLLIFRRVLPRPWQGWLLAAGIWGAQLACSELWPGIMGNPGWLAFGQLLGLGTGIYHPAAPDESRLSPGRQLLGWLMLAIFVLCFSASPFA